MPENSAATRGTSAVTFRDLADRLLALAGPHRIVAIDGPGGAGKSTFADRLVASIEAPTTLIHTDSFATPDQPTEWWPTLRTVIEQLAAGHAATFEPYDWGKGSLEPLTTVEPTSLVIIEGVSSSRQEWAEHISFGVWIEASPSVCRQRGVARDGVEPNNWDEAALAEAAFFTLDGAVDRADLIVDSSVDNGFELEIGFAVRL